jgi:hypothetical protein
MPDANRMPVPMESHQADFPHSLLEFCTMTKRNHSNHNGDNMTTKTTGLARTKPNLFGVPSLETARAIDDSDKAAGLQAAHYRLSARMRELEQQFDVKASELRASFVAECAEIIGSIDE